MQGWTGYFLGRFLPRGARRSPHLGPTQKPVALSVWLFTERYKLKPGSLVFVPCMGSGPDLTACGKLGLRCIACDVSLTFGFAVLPPH